MADMEFGRKLVSDIMTEAGLEIRPEDILEVDMESDIDRIYFTLVDGEDGYYIRVWDMLTGKKSGIEYTLFKANDKNGADEVAEGFYPCEIETY